MWTRKSILALLISLLVLGQIARTGAEEIGDPIVKLNGSQDIELDLAVMVDDLLPRLLAAAAEDDPEDAEMLGRIVDLVGFDALQRLTARTKQSRDHASSKFRITLDPDKNETLLYRLLTTPNRSCDFARYVRQDDLVLFVTLHNFPHYLEVFLDFLAQPEMAEVMGEMPLNSEGDLDLGGFVPRRDLLPLLAGELDFFFLEAPVDAPVSPMSAPYFLVLGATDGFALRDRILEIAGMVGGDAEGEISSMLASADPEMVGDFEMKVLPIGAAIAVNQDYLVIGMAPEAMREMLRAAKGDLRVPDGIEWAHIDGAKYGAFMESVMDMASMMSPEDPAEDEWLMEIYSVLFQHMDSEEILYRSRKDGLEGQIDVDGPILSGLYQMLPTLLDELPELMAAEKEDEAKNAYRGAVGQVDEAMMAYAVAHDGTYPEDPTQLLEEGYLQDWPFAAETPAGQYSDWSYSYHTYRDESGAVNGYLFFVYGGGEGTGFDVYTTENVAAAGPFQVDRDGTPDGVVSFCYDGVTIPMMENYFAK